jgi:hypothetical protein
MGYDSYEGTIALKGIIIGAVLGTIFWLVIFGIGYWIFG